MDRSREAFVQRLKGALLSQSWDTTHIDHVEWWLWRHYCDFDYDKVSNVRIARNWIQSEVDQYDKKYKNGSHGFVDGGISTHDHKTIRIGFNYE